MTSLFFFCSGDNLWLSWCSLMSDGFLIQFFLIYVLYLMFSTLNMYYVLLYMFIEIFLFGIFLSIYQMELFTGFLWVVEGTVIFIALLLLFYLNVEGNQLNLNLKLFKFYKSLWLFLVFLPVSMFSYISEIEFFLPNVLNTIDLWDDFYEALSNSSMNDFTVLTVSYYSMNSFEFLCVGLLLLMGSVCCVNLNKVQKNLSVQKYDLIFSIFDFFKDFINYTFMSKQNLMKQANLTPSVSIFKSK